jgi:hypothetical protein
VPSPYRSLEEGVVLACGISYFGLVDEVYSGPQIDSDTHYQGSLLKVQILHV